jgi:hypothetical protein
MTQPAEHPIEFSVTDDLRRSRITVFFRLLLAIPHFFVLALWGILVYIVWVIAWFAALFMGRVPGGLHNFIASFLRYSTHVNAYVLLLANPWPPFGGGDGYPIDVHIAGPAKQSRLSVFFRYLLAIPALLLWYVFSLVNRVIALISWFYALFTGRMNEGMRDLSVWLLRYETQTQGYLMLLTSKYPSLSGSPKP